MAARYALLSSSSSAEPSSVRAFVRITCAASSRESPAMSVSHTNASMPSVAPIPKTNRSSSGSGMRPFRGERASSIHPIRRTQGKTTLLHTHPNVDETLIVLEGEILVYAEEREHRVGPHGVAVAPRGDAHAFMVTSESALILFLQTPGSGEAFYRDASEPSTDDTDAERPPDLVRLRAAAQRHPDIIEILGPPPFEAAREESAARAKA
jgi:mannose-6-phosphate isomerase-like protein (cupin superfamily)